MVVTNKCGVLHLSPLRHGTSGKDGPGRRKEISIKRSHGAVYETVIHVIAYADVIG